MRSRHLGFFEPRVISWRAPAPLADELQAALAALRSAERPLLIAGGGVLYSGGAAAALQAFAHAHGIPVAETQAGKSALPWDHPLNLGAIGVTGSPSANALAQDADLVIAVGTRLQDFTTGSNTLFASTRVLAINVNAYDALKHDALAVEADARLALDALSTALGDWQAAAAWTRRAREQAQTWRDTVDALTGNRPGREHAGLPYDADVIGAVQRSHADSASHDICVCAAGTLPAELHKLWRAGIPGTYHVEYGYSCMGYEIAGGLGVKMARPDREVFVMVGDGSYLMMNSEIATSVMLGLKLIIIVLDNRGYGCINRLQQACGTPPFNNLLEDCLQGPFGAPQIDFAAHARALGSHAVHVDGITQLAAALKEARAADRTFTIVIDTDPARTTPDGGCWWEVAIPEVSESSSVRAARAAYEIGKKQQRNLA